MKLERVVTALPPMKYLRSLDTTKFAHLLYEDIRTGHVYIVQPNVKRGNAWGECIKRLTND